MGETSLAFAHLNANKRTLELDLQTPEGRDRLRGLAAEADVLIESGAPGWLAGLELDYDRLREINPALIMASITGFGQWGPHSGLAYNDLVVFAMCGLMSISGDPDAPPCVPPETQAYYFGSLVAALGIVAALHRRERTGAGDWIDVSMQEALATQEHMVRLYANEQEIHTRAGSQHQHVAPARIFPCRDGYVYMYVSRQHWQRFLDIWPGHPEEFDAPEYLNNLFRRSHADVINPAVSEFTRQYSMEELTHRLQSNRIPCLPVNRPLGFLRDPHVEGRHFVQEVPYPDGTLLTQPALPCLFSGSRPEVLPPRPVGQVGSEVWSSARNRDQAASDGSPSAAAAPAEAGADGRGLPLQGMRVLSFDHVLAGPFGMMLLADLGAEVLKVESAKGGLDPFRFFGTGDDPNASPRFLEFNRNKRSVTVNLKHPEGPGLIRELARHCDLVLDNFAARVMPGLGLDYEHLVEQKPDIVTLRMPGLGATGPKKDSLTLGTIITGFTGFTWLWNESAEVNPPVGSGTVLPDYVSGVVAAILSVAVTLYRRRTGRGMAMDLAQAEAAAFLIGTAMIQAANTDTEPVAVGNRSPYHAPYGIYACKGERSLVRYRHRGRGAVGQAGRGHRAARAARRPAVRKRGGPGPQPRRAGRRHRGLDPHARLSRGHAVAAGGRDPLRGGAERRRPGDERSAPPGPRLPRDPRQSALRAPHPALPSHPLHPERHDPGLGLPRPRPGHRPDPAGRARLRRRAYPATPRRRGAGVMQAAYNHGSERCGRPPVAPTVAAS